MSDAGEGSPEVSPERSEPSDVEKEDVGDDPTFDPAAEKREKKKLAAREAQERKAVPSVPAGTMSVPMADDDDTQKVKIRPVANIKFQDIVQYRKEEKEQFIHVDKLRWDPDGRYGQIRKLRRTLVKVYKGRLLQKLPLRNPVRVLLYERGGLCFLVILTKSSNHRWNICTTGRTAYFSSTSCSV